MAALTHECIRDVLRTALSSLQPASVERGMSEDGERRGELLMRETLHHARRRVTQVLLEMRHARLCRHLVESRRNQLGGCWCAEARTTEEYQQHGTSGKGAAGHD